MIIVILPEGEIVTPEGRTAIEPERGKAPDAERVCRAADGTSSQAESLKYLRDFGDKSLTPSHAISTAYKRAAEMPDLYRACLNDPRTRQAHLSALSRYAEQNFRDRLTALGNQPHVPVPVMARAFAGAHIAILDAWLGGELDGDVEELASMTLDLLINGTAWAHGIRLDEFRHSEDAGHDTP